MRTYFTLAILVISIVFVGVGCSSNKPVLKPVTLAYWRTTDTSTTLDTVIANYQKIHPNINIKITTVLPERYEDTLITALAEDRGPDLFSIPNIWLRGWQNRLLPMPKETKIANITAPSLTIRQLILNYVEAVPADVLLVGPSDTEGAPPEQRVFGLPYSLDTLALYYNRDALNRANIEKPPSTWTEFQNTATALTAFDKQQNITLSGAAFGTANNVRYSTEILSALMAQNGAVMADESGAATFEQYNPTNRTPNPPAVDALIFYESFAVKGAQNQTWDVSFPDSLDAFIAGKTAMYIGYPTDMNIIRARAPKLNFAIAPLPQVNKTKPLNIAKYPVEVVSKKTAYPNEAWDFIQFAAGAGQVDTFLLPAKRPTALRGLIKSQMGDPDIASFTGQILTALSWYKGVDYSAVEKIFTQMISAKLSLTQPTFFPIVANAASQVNTTIR